MGKEAPHVGFPEAVISKYAQKLVAIGYKVGVVEQMETPQELKARNDAKPKGVKKESAVRRELCQVLTKGTAANADVDATYLLAVTEDVEAGSIGVCYVDAQTAAFSFGECVDDEHHSCLRTLLAQLRPAEVVIDATKISREAHALLRRAVPPNQLSALPAAAWWAPAAARREVGGYFDDGSAGGGGGNQKWPDALAAAAEEGGKETKPLGLAAVGGCVSYLRRLLLDRQTVPLGNFTTWTPSDGVEATAAVRARPPVEPPPPPTPTAASTTTAAATSPPLTSLPPSLRRARSSSTRRRSTTSSSSQTRRTTAPTARCSRWDRHLAPRPTESLHPPTSHAPPRTPHPASPPSSRCSTRRRRPLGSGCSAGGCARPSAPSTKSRSAR